MQQLQYQNQTYDIRYEPFEGAPIPLIEIQFRVDNVKVGSQLMKPAELSLQNPYSSWLADAPWTEDQPAGYFVELIEQGFALAARVTLEESTLTSPESLMAFQSELKAQDVPLLYFSANKKKWHHTQVVGSKAFKVTSYTGYLARYGTLSDYFNLTELGELLQYLSSQGLVSSYVPNDMKQLETAFEKTLKDLILELESVKNPYWGGFDALLRLLLFGRPLESLLG